MLSQHEFFVKCYFPERNVSAGRIFLFRLEKNPYFEKWLVTGARVLPTSIIFCEDFLQPIDFSTPYPL